MEEAISLQDIFGIIKKRMSLILTTMFLGIGVSAIITYVVITPKYSSSSEILVTLSQNENQNVNVGDVNANLMMINTYKDIITKQIITNEAFEILSGEGNFKGTEENLASMLDVSQSQNSQMFTLTAISTNPVQAQAVASTVAKVFQEQAKELVNADRISILADAKINSKPISPNNKIILLIGLFLGVIVGAGIAFLIEILDKTIKDDKYVTEVLGFSILGTVPEMTAKELSEKYDSKKIKNDVTAPENEKSVSETRRQRNRV